MLKPKDNDLLCRVGPGTPMGALFRRFWLPALIPEELPAPDCDPVRLRLLGEDLVLISFSLVFLIVVAIWAEQRHIPSSVAAVLMGAVLALLTLLLAKAEFGTQLRKR